MVIGASELYIFILFIVTLIFTQGHRDVKKQKNVCAIFLMKFPLSWMIW